jgi:hypothetical protein
VSGGRNRMLPVLQFPFTLRRYVDAYLWTGRTE